MGAWVLGAAALGGAIDAYGAGKARSRQKRTLHDLLGEIGQQEGRVRAGYARAQATQRSAIPLVQKAYAGARANTAYLADTTKRQVSAQEPSRLAASDASLFGAGHGASNLVGLSHRGEHADTARALSDIDRMYAQQFSQLGVGEASQVADIKQRQAGFDLALGEQLQGLLNKRLDLRAQFAGFGAGSQTLGDFGGLLAAYGGDAAKNWWGGGSGQSHLGLE